MDLARMPEDFVEVLDFVPEAVLEMRYHSTYNFVGSRIDGYDEPVALLTRQAAQALARASEAFLARGLRMRIFDAYRPARAVAHFRRWAADPGDVAMKPYFYPHLEKAELFEKGYIGSMSPHSRGSTVDLTLFDMRTGNNLDMGSPFDFFGAKSHSDYSKISDEAFENRMVLRRTMLAAGFVPVVEEWWHFTLGFEPYPDTYFDFPVRRPAG